MLGHRAVCLAALALACTAFAPDAHAAYMYDVLVNPSDQLITTSGGSTIRIVPQTGRNFLVDPAHPLNNLPLATISFEKTTPGMEMLNVDYAMELRLTNPQESVNSGTFTVTGRLFGSVELRADGSKRLELNNIYESITPNPPVLSIGGADFTFALPLDQSFKFAGPGFGPGLNGTFTAQINVVPEPASVVLLGLGCGGAVWFAMRQRRQVQQTKKLDSDVAA